MTNYAILIIDNKQTEPYYALSHLQELQDLNDELLAFRRIYDEAVSAGESEEEIAEIQWNIELIEQSIKDIKSYGN